MLRTRGKREPRTWQKPADLLSRSGGVTASQRTGFMPPDYLFFHRKRDSRALVEPGSEFIRLLFQWDSRIATSQKESLHVQLRKTLQAKNAILHHVYQFVKQGAEIQLLRIRDHIHQGDRANR